ncbi:MAG: hypothetical protein WBD74_08225 [Candidatus Aquilonibacter sp.]
MRVEILTFDGCPNADVTRDRLLEAMRLESVDAAIASVTVATPDEAQRTRFLGSPSVRIDGRDVEPSARGRTDYGLMCRTYRSKGDVTGAPSVEMIRAAMSRDDMLGSRWLAFATFWLQPLVLVASGFLNPSHGWKTGIWVGALAVMGAGCVVNGLRCGRMHCYFTGPFFLIMAVVALAYGLSPAAANPGGWNAIAAVVLGGAIILYAVPERIFGKYRKLGA